jgi:integrase
LLTSRRLKTDGRERVVPFPGSMNDEIQAHLKEFNLRADDCVFGMLSRVETRSGVTVYDVNAAHRAGRRALQRWTPHEAREAGADHDGLQTLRVKDLRHIAAINWVKGGVSLQVVKQYLGHTSIAQTEVYARYVPKAAEFSAAVQALRSAFGE